MKVSLYLNYAELRARLHCYGRKIFIRQALLIENYSVSSFFKPLSKKFNNRARIIKPFTAIK
jgi:hypothetical protein